MELFTTALNVTGYTVASTILFSLAGGLSFLFTFFSQAGWWFNFCFYVLLTATSVGPNGYYVSSPHLVWRRTINIGQSDNYEHVIDSNHAKFSHAKFTLKLK